jgi:hypothetical protein
MFISTTITVTIVSQEISDFIDHFGRLPVIDTYVNLVQACNENITEPAALAWLHEHKQMLIGEAVCV